MSYSLTLPTDLHRCIVGYLKPHTISVYKQVVALTWQRSYRLFMIRQQHYKDELLHGICRALYSGGQLFEILAYRNGKKHGWSQRWYPDGAPCEVITYCNGWTHGIHQQWDTDGSITLMDEYDEGFKIPSMFKLRCEAVLRPEFEHLQYEEPYKRMVKCSHCDKIAVMIPINKTATRFCAQHCASYLSES